MFADEDAGWFSAGFEIPPKPRGRVFAKADLEGFSDWNSHFGRVALLVELSHFDYRPPNVCPPALFSEFIATIRLFRFNVPPWLRAGDICETVTSTKGKKQVGIRL
jgi:hypothetical protein